MTGSVGEAIRAVREAVGLQAKDLASRVSLSPSAMSQIESGQRNVKAAEVVAIAEALGVSPLALLDSDSLVGRVAIAARTTETVLANESALLSRLGALAEVASLLPARDRVPWQGRPAVDIDNWLPSARALATWAREVAPVDDDDRPGDQLLVTATAIQLQLGIDVVVEDFDDAVIGGAIVGQELPVIVLNSNQGRQRALFTLAHELGHVLAADGTRVACDADFRSASGSERFANAFAAEFLLPASRVRRLIEGIRDSRAAVGTLMLLGGLSKQTSVYRLHNLHIINAEQRDSLLRLNVADFAQSIEGEERRELLLARSDALSPRIITPVNLLNRMIDAYQRGVISAAPLAGLIGISVDEVIDQLGGGEVRLEMAAAPLDVQVWVDDAGGEAAFDGVPA